MIVLWSIVCALLNRFRGGLFHTTFSMGTTLTRLFVALLIISPTITTVSTYQFLGGWSLLYLGFIPGWKAWQGMSNPTKDIWSLNARGALLTGLSGLVLGNIPFALSGACMGFLYAIGLLLPKWRELDDFEDMNNSTWGEYLLGALMGGCLIYGM